MPIEIRELVIRATVSEPERREQPVTTENVEELKKEVIAACVEKVMEILRNQKER